MNVKNIYCYILYIYSSIYIYGEPNVTLIDLNFNYNVQFNLKLINYMVAIVTCVHLSTYHVSMSTVNSKAL